MENKTLAESLAFSVRLSSQEQGPDEEGGLEVDQHPGYPSAAIYKTPREKRVLTESLALSIRLISQELDPDEKEGLES